MNYRENDLTVAKSYVKNCLWSRGALEWKLFHEHKISPLRATGIRRTLKSDGFEHHIKIPHYSRPLLVYGSEDLCNHKLEEFSHCLTIKDELFNLDIGTDAEQYVRALFWQSNIYKSITQVSKLGKAGTGKTNWDMIATLDGIRLGIEIKNRREVYYPGNNIFKALIENALRENLQPVIVLAHASAEAQDYCRSNGIALLHLKYQLISKDHNRNTKKLETIPENILHPQEYRLINNPHRPFQHIKENEDKHLLEIVSNKNWILESNQIWRKNINKGL